MNGANGHSDKKSIDKEQTEQEALAPKAKVGSIAEV